MLCVKRSAGPRVPTDCAAHRLKALLAEYPLHTRVPLTLRGPEAHHFMSGLTSLSITACEQCGTAVKTSACAVKYFQFQLSMRVTESISLFLTWYSL